MSEPNQNGDRWEAEITYDYRPMYQLGRIAPIMVRVT